MNIIRNVALPLAVMAVAMPVVRQVRKAISNNINTRNENDIMLEEGQKSNGKNISASAHKQEKGNKSFTGTGDKSTQHGDEHKMGPKHNAKKQDSLLGGTSVKPPSSGDAGSNIGMAE